MTIYQDSYSDDFASLNVGNVLLSLEFYLQEKARIEDNRAMPEDIKSEKLQAIDELIKSRAILWQ